MKLVKLEQVRKQHHMSCQEVAKRVGFSRQYYWLIENGQRTLSYENAKKIAAIFDLKPDDLFF